ncbi:hypothetical protein, partial [Streptomyces phaeochromogenes]
MRSHRWRALLRGNPAAGRAPAAAVRPVTADAEAGRLVGAGRTACGRRNAADQVRGCSVKFLS